MIVTITWLQSNCMFLIHHKIKLKIKAYVNIIYFQSNYPSYCKWTGDMNWFSRWPLKFEHDGALEGQFRCGPKIPWVKSKCCAFRVLKIKLSSYCARKSSLIQHLESPKSWPKSLRDETCLGDERLIAISYIWVILNKHIKPTQRWSCSIHHLINNHPINPSLIAGAETTQASSSFAA